MSVRGLARLNTSRRKPVRSCLAPLLLCLGALMWGACGVQGGPVDASGDVIDWGEYPESDVVLPQEFPLEVGHYWPAGAPFSALVDGQELEIVQGFQGGVHLEVAFEIDLGLAYAETQIVYFDLFAQTFLEGADSVAELELANFKAGNMGFGVFRSQTIPIIFEKNQAAHYADRAATIVVQLTLDGALSAKAIPVQLIDTRDETAPQ